MCTLRTPRGCVYGRSCWYLQISRPWTFDQDVVMDKVKGEPVYLILAMDQDKVLRLKPQNLVTGLPIKHLEAVT